MLTLNDGRSELWQWDTGRTLAVDADCSQVHFSNKVFGRSIDVDVVDGVAIIPDILLQTDKDLNVWAFVGTAENGYTKISKTFKVNRRNKPADYVFTPTDQTSLEEIKEKLDYLESIQDPDAIKNAVEDYLEQNPVEAPVQSVNGRTGEVELTAEDVGAISQDNLQEVTNEVLAQAKASGEFDGADGQPGENGADGYSPTANVVWNDDGATITITDKNGTTTATVTNGKNGVDGSPGKDGATGADGKSAYDYAVEGGYAGTETEFAAKLAEEMPTTLPNPNAITFTGAVTGSYDGSEPLTVNIPSSGGGSGGSDALKAGYTLIMSETLTESSAINIADDGTYNEILIFIVCPSGEAISFSKFTGVLGWGNRLNNTNIALASGSKRGFWGHFFRVQRDNGKSVVAGEYAAATLTNSTTDVFNAATNIFVLHPVTSDAEMSGVLFASSVALPAGSVIQILGR